MNCTSTRGVPSAKLRRAVEATLRGRPGRRLPVEPLEVRRLLTTYSLSSVLGAYDGTNGIGGVAAQANAIAGPLGVSIPLLSQSIAAALGISGDVAKPFQTDLSNYANKTWSAASAALTDAGFKVLYSGADASGVNFTTDPNPQSPTYGDLLAVSWSKSGNSNQLFDNGSGQTGFSYLDAAGLLLGGVTFAAPTVTFQTTLGIDLVNGTPAFFLANSSGVSVTGLSATGTLGGDLNIGSLADVNASATATLSIPTAGVTFKDVNQNGKLRASDVANIAADLSPSLSGSLALAGTFGVTLSGLPKVNWTGSFNGTIDTGGFHAGPVSLQEPSASQLLGSFAQSFFSLGGGIPVLGPLADALNQDLPIIDESIAGLTGLDQYLPALPSLPTAGLLHDLGSGQPFTLALGPGTLSIDITPGTIDGLLNGQPEELVSWSTGRQSMSLLHYQQTFPLFSLGIPGVASAELDATFGVNATLNYDVGFGIDTHGFWIHGGSQSDPLLSLSFGATAGVQGQVELFGFPLADAGGNIGFSVTPYIALATPPTPDNAAYPDHVYLSDLQEFGSNTISDFFDALDAGVEGDFTGEVYAGINLLFVHLNWSFGVDIPVFNFEKTAAWPDYTAGASGTDPWAGVVSVTNGVLTFNDAASAANDNVTLTPNPDGSLTLTWAGHPGGTGSSDARTYPAGTVSSVALTGGTGSDRLDAAGVDVPITATLNGGPGSHSLVQGGDDGDTITDGGAGTSATNAPTDTLMGGKGNDAISGSTSPYQNLTILGNDGQDTLTAGAGTAQVYSGSGNSTLIGGPGNDSLFGGGGNDVIYGGSGLFFVDGGSGNDTIFGYGTGGPSNVTKLVQSRQTAVLSASATVTGLATTPLYVGETVSGPGIPANDTVAAIGSGSITLAAAASQTNAAAPLVFGSSPLIHAGTGRTVVHGGATPTFIYGDGGAGDQLTGGSGRDTIYGGNGGGNLVAGAPLSAVPWAQQPASTTKGVATVTLPSGASSAGLLVGDAVNGAGISPGTTIAAVSGTTVTLSTAATATGSNVSLTFGGNTLFGQGDGDTLVGGAGNNTLTGGPGHETLFGGAGPATSAGGDASVDNLGTGVNYANGTPASTGSNLVVAGSGTDVLFGDSTGQNTLQGGTGSDTLYAGPAGDYLAAGTGVQALYGGPGDDSLQANFFTPAGQPAETVDGGAGLNTLVLTPGGALPGPGTLTATIGTTDTTIAVTNGAVVTSADIAAGYVVEVDGEQMEVTGVNGNVLKVIRGFNGTTATPHAGPSTNPAEPGSLVAPVSELTPANTPAYYTSFSQTGTNQYQATLSNLTEPSDTAGSQLGQTTLTLPADIQQVAIEGGPGDNVIYVAPSVVRDVYEYGGPGHNTLHGGSGNDTLVGGPGSSVIYGGSGNTILYGGDLPAEDAQPVLETGESATGQSPTYGNNTLIAGTGSDELFAGRGNDVLIGGTASLRNGRCLLTNAGGGGDTLVGGSGADLLVVGPGATSGIVFGGTGSDTIIGDNDGPDVLEGGTGAANLILGDNLNNVIVGGTGNDTLVGGYGIDYVQAGVGNQTLYAAPDAASWQTAIATAANTYGVVLSQPTTPLAHITATLARSSNVVTVPAGTSQLWVGEAIGDAGNQYVPAGTTIAAILSNTTIALSANASANVPGSGLTETLTAGDARAEFTTLQGESDTLAKEIEPLIGQTLSPDQQVHYQDLLNEYETILTEQKNVAAFLGGSTFVDSLIGGGGTDAFYGNVGSLTSMGGNPQGTTSAANYTFHNYANGDTVTGGGGPDNVLLFQVTGAATVTHDATNGSEIDLTANGQTYTVGNVAGINNVNVLGIQTLGTSRIQMAATTTAGGTTVAGLTGTAGLYIGQGITGPGISIGTTVSAINTAANSVTLSTAATASAVGVVLAFAADTVTIGSPTLANWKLSVRAGSGDDLISAPTFLTGETLTGGTGADVVQIAATVAAATAVTGNGASELDIIGTGTSTVTVANGTLTVGVVPVNYQSGVATTNGSKLLTGLNTLNLFVGQTVVGSGIPAGATIASIPSVNSVLLSAAATATSAGEQVIFPLGFGKLTVIGGSGAGVTNTFATDGTIDNITLIGGSGVSVTNNLTATGSGSGLLVGGDNATNNYDVVAGGNYTVVGGHGTGSTVTAMVPTQGASAALPPVVVSLPQGGNPTFPQGTRYTNYWNPYDQFELSYNPNGVWSYGWGYGSTLSDFRLDPGTGTPQNGAFGWYSAAGNGFPEILEQGGAAAGYVELAPGDGTLAKLLFNAPYAGSYRFVGSVSSLGNATTDAYMVENTGTQVFAYALSGTSQPGYAFDDTVSTVGTGVNAVGFTVDYGSNRSYSSDSTGLSVQVYLVNAVPSVAGLFFNMYQGQQATGNVLSSDSTPSGNALTAQVVAKPAHGTLTLAANGQFTYSPLAGYQGPDSFQYAAVDGPYSTVATIQIGVDYAVPATVTVTPSAGAVFAPVPITYTLIDGGSYACSVVPQYSTGDGIWHAASAYSNSMSYATPTAGLAATPSGNVYTFLWDSNKDLGGDNVSGVLFRLVPSDAYGTGLPSETGAFAVSNSGVLNLLTIGLGAPNTAVHLTQSGSVITFAGALTGTASGISDLTLATTGTAGSDWLDASGMTMPVTLDGTIGTGNDTLSGGAGSDTLVYAPGPVNSGSGDNPFYPGDRSTYDGGGGADNRLVYYASSGDVFSAAGGNTFNLDGVHHVLGYLANIEEYQVLQGLANYPNNPQTVFPVVTPPLAVNGLAVTGNTKSVSVSLSGTVTDTAGGTDRATINWGDGTTSPATLTAAGNGTYTVSGSHVYTYDAADPTYTVTLTTIDPAGTAATTTTTYTGGLAIQGGNLVNYVGTAYSSPALDTGVKSFVVRNADATVFSLHTNGRLYALVGSAAPKPVEPGTTAVSLGADNTLYVLAATLSGPELYSVADGSISATDYNPVQSFFEDSSGTLYVLGTDGTLSVSTTGLAGLTVVRSNVQSIALAADGAAVNVLETDGDYSRFDGTTWTLLAEPVLQVTVGSAVAGSPTAVTVTAMAYDGQTGKYDIQATGYASTVMFASSDPAAGLPGSYSFTAADAGSHTFAVTFKTVVPAAAGTATPGMQTLSVTDNQMPAAVTASVLVRVTPSAAVGFTVTPVVDTSVAGTQFGVAITAVDAYGNTVGTYVGTVKLTSTDPNALAVLPAGYTFTEGDDGVRVFPVTLVTEGGQTVTATDGTGLTGTGNVAVTPASFSAAKSTLVVGPTSVTAGSTATVVLTARDVYGNPQTAGGLSVLFNAAAADGLVNPGQLPDPRNPGHYISFLDNGDGTYTGVVDVDPSAATAETATVTALVNNQHVTATAKLNVAVPTQLSNSGSFYLRLDADGQHIDVWDTATGVGGYAQQLTMAQVAGLTLSPTGTGGSVTIDESAGNVIPMGGLTVAGTGATPLLLVGTAGADTLTFNAGQLVFDGLSVAFAGTAGLTFNPNGGTDALTVNAGTVAIAAPPAGSGLTLRRFSSLAVAAGATVKVADPDVPADRVLLLVTTLSVAETDNVWTGTLDLGGNDMDLPSGSLSTMTAMVASGFDNGLWAGRPGLASSAAAANAQHLTALGVIQNVGADGKTAIFASFDGHPVSATDVLIKYTYYGDTNLDGAVNAADYTCVDAGFVLGLTGWANGDFNSDGVVDGSDYALMDNAFNQQGQTASPAAALASVAPAASPVASPAVLEQRAPTPAGTAARSARGGTASKSSPAAGRSGRQSTPGTAATAAWSASPFADAQTITVPEPNLWFMSGTLDVWRKHHADGSGAGMSDADLVLS